MSQRHKVFVSYHHANDQAYRDRFEQLFADIHDIMVPQSVQIGDIDEYAAPERIHQIIRDQYLRDTRVTVVLIGAETWQRKHVDWEIGSSIRQTDYNPRSGLIGILLPTYQPPAQDLLHTAAYRNTANNHCRKYYERTAPPRLVDNVKCGFAKIYEWSDDPVQVQQWIHKAFLSRTQLNPDNSFPGFIHNRSGSEWQR
ncbi:TIR domain-containing protein [Aliamphritea hakodatensis]|uniref:TIR domain-containing protein n=1 Tax=Aliamphritea hakodatensis TaxID=2895352 RepID=UPI0022FDA772|nr:TIR domain-containing protein [Aliamphritea hakodatensis]